MSDDIEPELVWCLYLLECSDGSYYCGITKDLQKRVRRHNSGAGAKYTKQRRPVRVIAAAHGLSEHSARRNEVQIKKLHRSKKVAAVVALSNI